MTMDISNSDGRNTEDTKAIDRSSSPSRQDGSNDASDVMNSTETTKAHPEQNTEANQEPNATDCLLLYHI